MGPLGGGHDKTGYTHVRDAVRGILLALDAEQPRYPVYNITGGPAYTTAQVGELIKEIFPAAELSPVVLSGSRTG